MAAAPYPRKAAVLGFRGVGKSAITRRCCGLAFDERYDPTTITIQRRTFRIEDASFNVDIVDTAGQDEHSRLCREASVGVNGYVLVFSVASRVSFEKLRFINDTLLDAIGVDSVPRVLVGNKIDLVGAREVPEAEARKLAETWGCPYVELSARDSESVDEVFITLIREFEHGSGTIRTAKPEPSKGSGCSIL